MKIYTVTGHIISSGVAVQHWHFAATRNAAVAYIADLGEGDGNELSVGEHTVEATREGVADALNYLIEWACLNEG